LESRISFLFSLSNALEIATNNCLGMAFNGHQLRKVVGNHQAGLGRKLPILAEANIHEI